MQISPINQSQSKHSFNGTVGKSVINLINGAVSQEMNAIVAYKNNCYESVTPKDLEPVKQFGNVLKEQLVKYMEPFHPQTRLEVFRGQRYVNQGDGAGFRWVDSMDFQFVNSKTKNVYNIREFREYTFGKPILEFIDRVISKKEYYTAEFVEKLLYTDYSKRKLAFAREMANYGFIGKLLTKINGKSADKVALEFGQPADLSVKMEAERLKELSYIKDHKKRIDENKKLLDSFLK